MTEPTNKPDFGEWLSLYPGAKKWFDRFLGLIFFYLPGSICAGVTAWLAYRRWSSIWLCIAGLGAGALVWLAVLVCVGVALFWLEIATTLQKVVAGLILGFIAGFAFATVIWRWIWPLI